MATATTRRQTDRRGWATSREVADYTGFTIGTLRVWRSSGKGPPFTGRDKGVRYLWADVDRWIKERDKA